MHAYCVRLVLQMKMYKTLVPPQDRNVHVTSNLMCEENLVGKNDFNGDKLLSVK